MADEKCHDSTKRYLVGNKIDEIEFDSSLRKIQEQEALNFASKNEMEYFEVSSVTSKNVDALFYKVCRVKDKSHSQYMYKSPTYVFI